MNRKLMILGVVCLMLIASGTLMAQEKGEQSKGEAHEKHGGEESGTQYTLTQTHDNIRNGMRMILAYDVKSEAFVGTIENTTKNVIKDVRMEVHLSNGKELGPTPVSDLAPGAKKNVKLSAKGEKFKTWSTHPESGHDEHAKDAEHEKHNEHKEHAKDSEHKNHKENAKGSVHEHKELKEHVHG